MQGPGLGSSRSTHLLSPGLAARPHAGLTPAVPFHGGRGHGGLSAGSCPKWLERTGLTL